MINVYVDKGVKETELFIKVMTSLSSQVNVFSDLTKISNDKVDVAIIWLSIPNCLKDFINLKLLLVSGSGIDHIVNSDLLPKSVTTIRLVDKKLRNKVADYVVNAVNNYGFLINEKNNSKITVGIMGLGLIGETSIIKLKQQNYNVIGWAKSKTKKRSISTFHHGENGLNEFAKKSQVIVCQLPLTEETRHILNKKLFYLMPKDGYIINVGRGWHLNENDLIDAINEEHLKGACLDVFKIEPLPSQDVLQNQPKIKITPHIAGGIFTEEQAKYALEIIYNFMKKKMIIEGLVDFKKKY